MAAALYGSDELKESIANGATSKVRQLLRKYKASSSSFPSIEPYLWMSLFRGNNNIFKLILKKSSLKSVLSSRHPRSGGTLLHAACFEGNYGIVKSLLKLKGSAQSWIHIRDAMQGHTVLEALMQGYHHQWMNYHNTPILAMLQGGFKDHVGTRLSFNKTLELLLPHVLSNRKLIHQLLDIQWSDGVRLVLDRVGSGSNSSSSIARWEHVVKSIQELFTLIVRLSKFITKHGNIAVGQDILNQYGNGSSFNSFTFLGISGLNNISDGPEEYSYDRDQLNKIVFDWHNRNILHPLLESILSDDGEMPKVKVSIPCSIVRNLNRFNSINTPLHAAAYMGYETGIHTLFKTLKLSSNGKCLDLWMQTKNSRGRTPYMSALASHNKNIAEFIRKQGGGERETERERGGGGEQEQPEEGRDNTNIYLDKEWIDPWNITKMEIEVDASYSVDNKVENEKRQVSGSATSLECNTIEWNTESHGGKVFELYYRSNVPVKIKSHSLLSKWQGFQYWKTVQYFQSTFPDRYFNVFGTKNSKGITNHNRRSKTMRMKIEEFMVQTFRDEDDSKTSSSTFSHVSPLWLVETDTNTLMDDTFSRHVQFMTGKFEFYENILKTNNNTSVEYSNYQFMIAPKLSGASPHFHNSAVNVLFTGQKVWYLFPPSSNFFTTMPVNQWVRQFEARPPGEQQPHIKCVQNPGDIIYVPDMWGHAVLSTNDETAIGIAHLFNG